MVLKIALLVHAVSSKSIRSEKITSLSTSHKEPKSLTTGSDSLSLRKLRLSSESLVLNCWRENP